MRVGGAEIALERAQNSPALIFLDRNRIPPIEAAIAVDRRDRGNQSCICPSGASKLTRGKFPRSTSATTTRVVPKSIPSLISFQFTGVRKWLEPGQAFRTKAAWQRLMHAGGLRVEWESCHPS